MQNPAYRMPSSSSNQPSLSSSPPKQTKVISQRQYREKEGECFSTLRDVIKELTGEELQKRQDILKRATDLLSTAVLEVRTQRVAQTDVLDPVGSAHGVAQASYYSEHFNVEPASGFGAAPNACHYVDPIYHDWRFTSGMDVQVALDTSIYQQFGERSPHFPNF